MSLSIITTEFETVVDRPTLLALGVEGAEGSVFWELTDVPHAVPTGTQLTAQGVSGTPNQIGRFTFKVSAVDQRQPHPQRAEALITVDVREPSDEERAAAAAPVQEQPPSPATTEPEPASTTAVVGSVPATPEKAPHVAEGAQTASPGATAPTQGL